MSLNYRTSYIVQDCSISSTLAMKILPYCTKTSIGFGPIGCILFNFFSVMVVALQSIATAIACAVASDVIHKHLIMRIMHASNTFLDTTPFGRILNRFSQDINAVDIRIRLNLSNVFRGITSLATTSLAICYSTPLFIIVLIPIALAFRVLQVNISYQ